MGTLHLRHAQGNPVSSYNYQDLQTLKGVQSIDQQRIRSTNSMDMFFSLMLSYIQASWKPIYMETLTEVHTLE